MTMANIASIRILSEERTEHMRVVIIGAGMGGLSAAIRLAAHGHDVTVIEQSQRVGGKLNRWQSDGWTFDTGPSLLTMPWVLRDLFMDTGRDLDDFLTLERVDPICRYLFADGTHLDVTSDTAQMAANIERLSPRDVPAFFRFLAYASDLYALAGVPFLRYPLGAEMVREHHREMFRYGFRPGDLRKLASRRSVHGSVSHYFTDPRIRQVFDRYATYNGSSPYDAPTAFCLIPFVEFSTGAWHPIGGMYRIAEALVICAEQVSARISLNTAVDRIIIRNNVAVGVQCADGTVIPADAVISNVDVLTTHEQLICEDDRAINHERQRLRSLEPSYSGFLLLLGTRGMYPALTHHSIFFSADYRAEFADIRRHKVPPSDPTIYVCRATATDGTVAPPGCDNLFVMVNVPYLDGQTDWQQIGSSYRDHIIDTLRRRGVDLQEIVVEAMWTPETIRDVYGAQRGAIYGFASNNRRSAFLRPPNRSAVVHGLYFAGGSTHPGGGVPLALLSGQIAANLVIADSETPSRRPMIRKGRAA